MRLIEVEQEGKIRRYITSLMDPSYRTLGLCKNTYQMSFFVVLIGQIRTDFLENLLYGIKFNGEL